MSDIPEDAIPGEEELDLGEVDEAEVDGQEDGTDGGDPGEDAGGDGEAEGQEEGEAGDVAPARSGRRSQSQRLRERNERLERELAEARGFRQAAEQFRPQQQPQVDPAAVARAQQERAERLNMMSPVEAAEFIANEKDQQFRQMLLYQQLQTEDRLDKRDYDQQARTSKVHSQYRDEVERVLATERQNGNLRASRDDILHRLVGRDAMERATRAAPRQRTAAAARVRGQTTRPTGARGDGAASGGRGKWGDPEFDEQMAREGLRKGIF